MPEAVLKVIANPANRAILGLLAVEPSYPRRIGELLDIPETEVARRLKHMERLGLVASAWRYIGKNVKAYSLLATGFAVTLDATGTRLRVTTHADPAPAAVDRRAASVDPDPMPVPVVTPCVGRDAERSALAAASGVTVLTGLPGVGKTHLAATLARGVDARDVHWHACRGVESLSWFASRLAAYRSRLGDDTLQTAVANGGDPAALADRIVQALDDPRSFVVIDDAHRLTDDAMRDVLREAMARVTRGRLIVITRDRAPLPARARAAAEVVLGGLDAAGVTDLASERGVTLSAAEADAFVHAFGGHPHAVELALEAGATTPEGAACAVAAFVVDAVDGHVTEDDRRVLALASMFTGPFRAADVATLLTRRPDGALLRLRRAGLVDADGDLFEVQPLVATVFRAFVHDAPRVAAKLENAALTERGVA